MTPAEVLKPLESADVSLRGWKPIETAPKDGTEILAYWGQVATLEGSGMTVIKWYCWPGNIMGWYGVVPSGVVLTGATHWMPLPEPPK